jgi:predicted kinase
VFRQNKNSSTLTRLTPDEWHTRLFGQDLADKDHDNRHNLIETIMWEVAVRVLSLNTSVILDFGLWAKEEREDFRARAAKLGASSEVHYLEVPYKELLKRLAARNAHLPPNTFAIPEEQLEVWMQVFQAPTADELKRYETKE